MKEDAQTCENCGIRHQAKKIAQTAGVQAAISFRIPVCGGCEHNPNMMLVKNILKDNADVAKIIMVDVQNNWRPIAQG